MEEAGTLDTPVKVVQARVLQTLEEVRQVVQMVGKRASVGQVLGATDCQEAVLQDVRVNLSATANGLLGRHR
jgi:hypothetical protein